MSCHPVFCVFRYAASGLVLASLVSLLCAAGWEYSTRRYLKGFADAVVPAGAPPEEKVQAILDWMENGPARRAGNPTESLAERDPRETLNYQALLNVCGTATNVFVNLADSSGLRARRLLLLDDHRTAVHVVAEVRLGGRWVVVTPAFRRILRDASGRMLTREQLEDPAAFHQATGGIPGYLPFHDYDLTSHIRLARVPYVGPWLRQTLNWVRPNWEESFDWTLVVERESWAATLAAALLTAFSLLTRVLLGWYGKKRLGIDPICLRHRLLHAGAAFWGGSR